MYKLQALDHGLKKTISVYSSEVQACALEELESDKVATARGMTIGRLPMFLLGQGKKRQVKEDASHQLRSGLTTVIFDSQSTIMHRTRDQHNAYIRSK